MHPLPHRDKHLGGPHCIPGPMPNAFLNQLVGLLWHPCEQCTCICFGQMKKLRPERFTPLPIAGQWWSQNSNPDLLDPKGHKQRQIRIRTLSPPQTKLGKDIISILEVRKLRPKESSSLKLTQMARVREERTWPEKGEERLSARGRAPGPLPLTPAGQQQKVECLHPELSGLHPGGDTEQDKKAGSFPWTLFPPSSA